MGFLQLEEEKSRTEKLQSRSIGNLRDKQGIRIGKSLVPSEYTISFSMKLSPQHYYMTRMLFAQRGVYLRVGGLLEFHC